MGLTPLDEGAVHLPRVSIDFKVPLWSLVATAGLGLGALITMYYRLDQVGRDVTEMQIAVRSMNGVTLAFAQDSAILKFRVDKLEQERKDRQ